MPDLQNQELCKWVFGRFGKTPLIVRRILILLYASHQLRQHIDLLFCQVDVVSEVLRVDLEKLGKIGPLLPANETSEHRESY